MVKTSDLLICYYDNVSLLKLINQPLTISRSGDCRRVDQSALKTPLNTKNVSLTFCASVLIIDPVAGLVASVCPSVCLWALSCSNRLTLIFGTASLGLYRSRS